MTTLAGHDEAWAEWRAAMASSRMHHAWLLAGKKGLGKAAFAHAAARELIGAMGEGLHPDILTPEHPPATKEDEGKRDAGQPYRKKRNIPVDVIRAMQARLTTRPTMGTRRAIIIDPADDLEKSAANALLKSLEEPPVGTFFLLIAHRPGQLLPTIRSRCRLLRFAPVPDGEVAAILARQAPQADAGSRAAAVAAAEGSPGAALGFVEQDLGKAHELMLRLLAQGDPHFALRGAFAEEIGARPDLERLTAVLDLTRAVLAANMARAPRAAQARIIESHAQIARLTAEAPTYNYDPGLLAMEIGGLLAGVRLDL